MPWKEWEEKVRPYYPKGDFGCPVVGIGKMLRMYMLQVWFTLSDKGGGGRHLRQQRVPTLCRGGHHGRGAGAGCDNVAEVPASA